MLQTAFLVTFCGLLVQMAQPQTLPYNQYPVALCSDTLNGPLTESTPSTNVLPLPTSPITDPSTGNKYTNLTPQEPTKVDCQVNTNGNGYLDVVVKGDATWKGDITGPQTTNGVSSDVSSLYKWHYKIVLTPKGDLTCGTTPSLNEVEVTCNSNPTSPSSGGILGSLLTNVLNILKGLLSTLNTTVTATIKSLLPSLLDLTTTTVNNIFGKLTESKQVNEKVTCKHTVKKVTTDPNNYIQMTVETNKYSVDGTLIPPPAGTYVPPVLTPEPDSACTWAIPEYLINNALGGYWLPPIEVTNVNALSSLSQSIKSVCGIEVSVAKLVSTSTGTPVVKITEDGITGDQNVNVKVVVSGSDTPLLEITLIIDLTGEYIYVKPSARINLTCAGMREVKFVKGQSSCDVSNQVSQIFTDELTGKLIIDEPTEPSPVATYPIKGPTKCTPKNGYVLVDHQK